MDISSYIAGDLLDALVLALDGITDPGNLGTLLRIADWFGVRQVWCSSASVCSAHPTTTSR